MGSTSFAMNNAVKAAIHLDAKVGMFGLELNKLSLLHRILASEAGVHIPQLVMGFLAKEDMGNVKSAMVKLDATRISIDDTAGISLPELRFRAKRLSEDQEGLDLILVDPLQFVPAGAGSTSRGTNECRPSDLSFISNGLKSLAEELDLPDVATLQLPKLKRRTGGHRRPTLKDLCAYGPIERDADQVVFVHREVYYRVDEKIAEADRRKAEVIVAKHRTCSSRTFDLDFNAAFTSFNDLQETD
jgi:replicative DNA helicase